MTKKSNKLLSDWLNKFQSHMPRISYLRDQSTLSSASSNLPTTASGAQVFQHRVTRINLAIGNVSRSVTSYTIAPCKREKIKRIRNDRKIKCSRFAKCFANININYTIYQINREAIAHMSIEILTYLTVFTTSIFALLDLIDLHEYLVFASSRVYVLLKYSFSRL